MNAKHLIAAAVVFAATGSAFAQQTEFFETTPHVSTKTRAEVIAEIKQAHQDGTLSVAQRDGQDAVVAAGKRSRVEVRAEAVQPAQDHYNASYLYFG